MQHLPRKVRTRSRPATNLSMSMSMDRPKFLSKKRQNMLYASQARMS